MAAEPLKGIALVIGQSDYENLSRLPNPSRDARRIEELLNKLGLDTDMVENRDARRLRRDFDGFLDDAEGADVALVYYSGHGIEAGGENFLLPVDADLGHVANAGEKFVSLEQILGELRRKAKITVFLLDACRTNPYPAGTVLTRGGDSAPVAISAAGLGTPRSAISLMSPNNDTGESLGIVIGYAAAPGEVALDGPEGGTSPYAAALLKHLGANDFDFADVMTMVSEEVYLATRSRSSHGPTPACAACSISAMSSRKTRARTRRYAKPDANCCSP